MLSLSLLVILLLLPLLLRKRFELLIAPFFCGVMISCYPFALIRRLDGFVWLAAAAALLAVIGAAVICLRDRARLAEWLRNQFTVGFFCFCLMSAFLYVGTQSRLAWWGDDIRYWAMLPKSMRLSNGLLDATMNLTPEYATYTPGMALLQWVAEAILGEWSDGALFFTLNLFTLSFLMPLTARLTWRKAYWAPLFLAFAIAFPTILNGFTYYALSVDTALGMCFGYALCQLWRARGGATRWGCLTLSLCALVLIKQSGALLLVAAAAFLPVALVGAGRRIRPARWIAAFGAPLLLLASWAVFCKANGLRGVHVSALRQHIGELLSGTWVAPQEFDLLLRGIEKALCEDLREYAFMRYHAPVEMPQVVYIAVSCALPFAFACFLKRERRALIGVGLWTIALLLLELVGMYGSFMTVFYSEVSDYLGDGQNLLPLLIARYFSPVFFGLAMMLLRLLLDHPLRGKARVSLTALGAAALLLLGNWSSVWYLLIPSNASEPDDFAASLVEQNFWTSDLDDPGSAVVLYDLEERQTEPWKWQYALAPVKLVYAPDLTEAELPNILRRNNVTHILCLDDANALYEAAAPYAEDGWIDTYTPYHVRWDGDALTLEW